MTEMSGLLQAVFFVGTLGGFWVVTRFRESRGGPYRRRFYEVHKALRLRLVFSFLLAIPAAALLTKAATRALDGDWLQCALFAAGAWACWAVFLWQGNEVLRARRVP